MLDLPLCNLFFGCCKALRKMKKKVSDALTYAGAYSSGAYCTCAAEAYCTCAAEAYCGVP